jgi:lipid-binding SYLF domain-containing protein
MTAITDSDDKEHAMTFKSRAMGQTQSGWCAVQLTMLIVMLATSIPSAFAASKEQQRAEVRKMTQATLNRLYKHQPAARKAILKSAGFAVFSNFGMKILVAGGGKGEGLAVNMKTNQETFMKMVEVQAGLGFGVKKFRLVWIFETPQALDTFVNSGWELGAQTTAAAQVSGQGAWASGAMSVSPGVWVYQLTDDGLALELTAKGTRYYKDDALN